MSLCHKHSSIFYTGNRWTGIVLILSNVGSQSNGFSSVWLGKTNRIVPQTDSPSLSSSYVAAHSKDVNGMGNDKNERYESSFSYEELDFVLQRERVRIFEHQVGLPPHPSLEPTEFVQRILAALKDSDEPWPDSGFRTLMRSSTPSWRESLVKCVGAPIDAEEEIVASALGSAFRRPRNQYRILVVEESENFEGQDEAEYGYHQIRYPSDVVDFGDGNCWLECRLHDHGGTLLVAMGWNLKQRDSDGAWLIDGLDWQDFRNAYRPGIGREEWMRICG